MILVTGGGGQLGTAFRSLRPECRFADRTDLDLALPGGLANTLAAWSPEAIINCAAYTAVDRAERDEVGAYTVNAEAVAAMARYAVATGIPLVTFSTDYVFDGAGTRPYVERDETDPINAYGRTKRAGERLALQIHPQGALVIRTSWLVSGTHPNFVATMLKLGGRGEPFPVVEDQRGCPTIADDLAAGALAALEAGATGIVHLVNPGETTWCEFARAVVAEAGMDASLVQPCASAAYPRPAPRPAYSVLGSERLADLGLASLPPWRESLPGLVAAQTNRARPESG